MKFSKLKNTTIFNTNPNNTDGCIVVKAWVSDCGIFAVHRPINGYDDEFYVTHLPSGARCSAWFEHPKPAMEYARRIAPLTDWSALKLKRRVKYDGGAWLKDGELSRRLHAQCLKIRNDIIEEIDSYWVKRAREAIKEGFIASKATETLLKKMLGTPKKKPAAKKPKCRPRG